MCALHPHHIKEWGFTAQFYKGRRGRRKAFETSKHRYGGFHAVSRE